MKFSFVFSVVVSAGYHFRGKDSLNLSSEGGVTWTQYDSYFSSNSSWPLSNYYIDILHANQPHLSKMKSWPIQALPSRLVCDLVWFTAHDYHDSIYSLEDKIRLSYAQFQEGVCLVNINGKIEDGERMTYLLERYRAGMIVSQLIFDGKIRTASGTFPMVIYTDGDAFPANKRLGPHDLELRYIKGVRQGFSAEQEGCKINSRITCPDPDQFPSTPTHIAFSMALEAYCASQWATNSGVWVFKPSLVVQTLLGSTIIAAKNKVKHRFDNGDQGYINYVMQELFGMTIEKLTAVCGQDEYYPEYWQKAVSVEESQFMLTRKFNLSVGLSHPVLKPVVELFLGRRGEYLNTSSPQYTAWVAPRWINAPGCPWYMFDPTRAQLAYHPGDFIVHFNSCNHAGWSSLTFRQQVVDHAKDIFPVNDEDRDWDQWLAGAANFQWVNLPKDKTVHGSIPTY